MRLVKLPFLFALLALAISACQEPIDLELEDNVPELVVEGYLAQRDYAIPEDGADCGGGVALSQLEIQLATAAADAILDIDSIEAETDYFPFNKVKLSTTANYFEEGTTPAVSNAVVRLVEDGAVVETLTEDPEVPGTYRITHLPQVGSFYHLEIEALDMEYETIPEEYQAVPPLITVPGVLPFVQYLPTFFGDTCQYQLAMNSYELEGTGDHYRWMFYLNNEYVDDPFFISTFDDSNVDGICLLQIDVYGDALELEDTLVVFQMKTSAGYDNFVNSLRNQTAFVGGPFDTPPAPIVGNIKNLTTGKDAFGYFACGGISANAAIVPDTIPTGGCAF